MMAVSKWNKLSSFIIILQLMIIQIETTTDCKIQFGSKETKKESVQIQTNNLKVSENVVREGGKVEVKCESGWYLNGGATDSELFECHNSFWQPEIKTQNLDRLPHCVKGCPMLPLLPHQSAVYSGTAFGNKSNYCQNTKLVVRCAERFAVTGQLTQQRFSCDQLGNWKKTNKVGDVNQLTTCVYVSSQGCETQLSLSQETKVEILTKNLAVSKNVFPVGAKIRLICENGWYLNGKATTARQHESFECEINRLWKTEHKNQTIRLATFLPSCIKGCATLPLLPQQSAVYSEAAFGENSHNYRKNATLVVHCAQGWDVTDKLGFTQQTFSCDQGDWKKTNDAGLQSKLVPCENAALRYKKMNERITDLESKC